MNLTRGSRGDDVRRVQEKLGLLGLYGGAIDGDFGPKTEAAVLAFRKNGVATVDDQTWQALCAVVDGKTAIAVSINLTERDLAIMALTCWGEARGEPYDGLKAVVWTIRNRAEWATDYRQRTGQVYRLFGDGSPASACLVAWQFSCWLAADPNSAKMRGMLVGADTGRGELTPAGRNDPSIQRALKAINEVFGETADKDATKGGTHYFDQRLKPPPPWSVGLTPSVVIGHHAFYAGVDHVGNPDLAWNAPTAAYSKPATAA